MDVQEKIMEACAVVRLIPWKAWCLACFVQSVSLSAAGKVSSKVEIKACTDVQRTQGSMHKYCRSYCIGAVA